MTEIERRKARRRVAIKKQSENTLDSFTSQEQRIAAIEKLRKDAMKTFAEEEYQRGREMGKKSDSNHIDSVFPTTVGTDIERETKAWIDHATFHEDFLEKFETEFKRKNKEMERRKQELQKAVEEQEQKARQVYAASHVCFEEQGTCWARVSLFDENHSTIQLFEGAHGSEKEAHAWADALERMLIHTWILW